MWIVFSLQTEDILGRFVEWQFCLPLGALAVLLTLGIWAIIRVSRWRQESMDVMPAPEKLLDYETMIEEGLLNPDELARIKNRMNPNNDRAQPDDASTADKPPADSPPSEG